MTIDRKEKTKVIGMFNQHKFDDILVILNQHDIEDDVTLLTIKGVIESIHNNYDAAIKSFETGLALNPEDNAKIDIILNLADSHCRHKRRDKVAEILKQFPSIFKFPSTLSNPDQIARSYLILAWNQFESNEYQKSLDLLTDIIEKGSACPSLIENAIFNRGICNFQDKKYNEAIADYNRLSNGSEFFSNGKILKFLAEIEIRLIEGDFDTAESMISDLKGEVQERYVIKIAEAAANSTSTELQNRIFDRLQSISSDSTNYATALLWAGQYAYNNNNSAKSIDLLKNINEKQHEHYARAQNLLGCIEYQREKYVLAKEHFNNILALPPGTFTKNDRDVFEENASINEASIP